MAQNVSGSRIELVLRADRFLFAPLELPGRAAEFLDGVARAQIDRLTPWGAAEAAFGWSKTTQAGTDRCITTIAATALGRITTDVKAMASLGAQSISVFTSLPEAGAGAPIKVFEGGAREPSMSDEFDRRLNSSSLLWVWGRCCGQRMKLPVSAWMPNKKN